MPMKNLYYLLLKVRSTAVKHRYDMETVIPNNAHYTTAHTITPLRTMLPRIERR
jgi:hypothetical protein